MRPIGRKTTVLVVVLTLSRYQKLGAFPQNHLQAPAVTLGGGTWLVAMQVVCIQQLDTETPLISSSLFCVTSTNYKHWQSTLKLKFGLL